MRTFRAPGRVNLIGDHTDYQDGLVLPVALQLETRVTADLGGDRVRLSSDSFPEEVDVAADGSDGPTGGQVGWGRYVAAVTWALAEVGRPAVGMEGTVASTVPAGAGLASSAALEVAVAAALLAAAGTEMDPLDVAQACRRAEVEGVGVPCGIMDQAVAVLGSSRGALLLDCRSLATDDVPLPGSHRLVVVDSGVSRELAASGYAERRHETDQGLSAIKVDHPEVSSLRDATLDMLDGLPPPLRERCRHVVTENARVVEVVRALRNRRLDIVGRLLDHSHHSMAVSFAASHPDVDVLAAELRTIPGVLGARMTGGGFGGTVVALVETAEAEGVAAAVAPRRAWVAQPSAGAGEVDT